MRSSPLLFLAGAALLAAAHASAQSRPATTQTAPAPRSAAESRAVAGGNAERGRYLAEHVAMCVECHSPRDGQGNVIESERYLGGAIPFAPPWPNDWAIRAPRNKGLTGYTDEQAMRLLTQGAIGRDGVVLRPPMPRFRMTPEDATDVIAFLRTVP